MTGVQFERHVFCDKSREMYGMTHISFTTAFHTLSVKRRTNAELEVIAIALKSFFLSNDFRKFSKRNWETGADSTFRKMLLIILAEMVGCFCRTCLKPNDNDRLLDGISSTVIEFHGRVDISFEWKWTETLVLKLKMAIIAFSGEFWCTKIVRRHLILFWSRSRRC